ncbi:MAG: tRNA uridine-5-carboxymethylaminomethyl(34) synthesis GTPase MnmE [Parabacteroides sp.]|nr:tRNA uridine-5-carboxymethylaminomethyl(34) synthesis GTPase MnmE [Parabacteroides sp.]
MTNQDTICAVSTAPGTGGIAVIRVSGPQAIEISDSLFTPVSAGKDLLSRKAYTLALGSIRKGNETVDDVLVSLFRAPHSFTGEDTVEITCHGSVYIQQRILQLLIGAGCRAALPGEFTQRAFLNGKMDLSQAEAVADLIASTSAGTHRLALSQMRGGFSNELAHLRGQLLDFTSLIELELDFSEEDVEFADRSNLKQLATGIERLIRRLTESFRVGNAIKNGIPVAIIGETNAGKSTLLNQLLHEEKAIVSDIHGTTRDVIEDTITLSGVLFRFIDTAGIRETADTIESLGIERTFRKLEQAAIVLWVIDLGTPVPQIEALAAELMPRTVGKKVILAFNKTDKLTPAELTEKLSLLPDITADRLYLSAKSPADIERLEALLLQAAHLPEVGQNDVIVTNIRHYEALTQAHAAILRVIDGLEQNLSGDFLSQDIRECMHYLGEITGQISNDEILGNIFGKFCIGK